MKQGMSRVEENVIKDLKNKKYFELSDLDRFSNVWAFFIKGKKGIGKSYSLIKLMNEVDASDRDMMVYLRTRREDIKSVTQAWQDSDKYPFYIKSKALISKKTGRVCGIVGYANNLGSLRSGAYENYKYIVYDEYVEQIKSNYKSIETFAQRYMKFIMDVYRDQNSIKCFAFGNDDITYDPFSEYFKIDVKDTYFNIDNYIGVLVGNLKDYYIGKLKDTKAYGLAYYDEGLQQFLDENKNEENLEQMINYSEMDGGFIEKYIYYDRYYLAMIRLKKDPNKFAFRVVKTPIDKIPIWTFEMLDYIQDTRSVLLKDFQSIPFINMLVECIKHNKYKFASSQAKELMEELIFNYRHKKVEDLYKAK